MPTILNKLISPAITQQNQSGIGQVQQSLANEPLVGQIIGQPKRDVQLNIGSELQNFLNKIKTDFSTAGQLTYQGIKSDITGAPLTQEQQMTNETFRQEQAQKRDVYDKGKPTLREEIKQPRQEETDKYNKYVSGIGSSLADDIKETKDTAINIAMTIPRTTVRAYDYLKDTNKKLNALEYARRDFVKEATNEELESLNKYGMIRKSEVGGKNYYQVERGGAIAGFFDKLYGELNIVDNDVTKTEQEKKYLYTEKVNTALQSYKKDISNITADDYANIINTTYKYKKKKEESNDEVEAYNKQNLINRDKTKGIYQYKTIGEGLGILFGNPDIEKENKKKAEEDTKRQTAELIGNISGLLDKTKTTIIKDGFSKGKTKEQIDTDVGNFNFLVREKKTATQGLMYDISNTLNLFEQNNLSLLDVISSGKFQPQERKQLQALQTEMGIKSEKMQSDYKEWMSGWLSSEKKDFNKYTEGFLKEKGVKTIDELFVINDAAVPIVASLKGELAFAGRDIAPNEFSMRVLNYALNRQKGAFGNFLAVIGTTRNTTIDTTIRHVTTKIPKIVGGTSLAIDFLKGEENVETTALGGSILGIMDQVMITDKYMREGGIGGASKFFWGAANASDEIGEIISQIYIGNAMGSVIPVGATAEGTNIAKQFSKGYKAANTFNKSDRIANTATLFNRVRNTAFKTIDTLQDFSTSSVVRLRAKRIANATVDIIGEGLTDLGFSSYISQYFNQPYTVGSTDFRVDMSVNSLLGISKTLNSINHLTKDTIEYKSAFSKELTKNMMGSYKAKTIGKNGEKITETKRKFDDLDEEGQEIAQGVNSDIINIISSKVNNGGIFKDKIELGNIFIKNGNDKIVKAEKKLEGIDDKIKLGTDPEKKQKLEGIRTIETINKEKGKEMILHGSRMIKTADPKFLSEIMQFMIEKTTEVGKIYEPVADKIKRMKLKFGEQGDELVKDYIITRDTEGNITSNGIIPTNKNGLGSEKNFFFDIIDRFKKESNGNNKKTQELLNDFINNNYDKSDPYRASQGFLKTFGGKILGEDFKIVAQKYANILNSKQVSRISEVQDLIKIKINADKSGDFSEYNDELKTFMGKEVINKSGKTGGVLQYKKMKDTKIDKNIVNGFFSDGSNGKIIIRENGKDIEYNFKHSGSGRTFGTDEMPSTIFKKYEITKGQNKYYLYSVEYDGDILVRRDKNLKTPSSKGTDSFIAKGESTPDIIGISLSENKVKFQQTKFRRIGGKVVGEYTTSDGKKVINIEVGKSNEEGYITILHEGLHAFVDTLDGSERDVFIKFLQKEYKPMMSSAEKIRNEENFDIAFEEMFVDRLSKHITKQKAMVIYNKFINFINKVKDFLLKKLNIETLSDSEKIRLEKYSKRLGYSDESGTATSKLIADRISENAKTFGLNITESFRMGFENIIERLRRNDIIVNIVEENIGTKIIKDKTFFSENDILYTQVVDGVITNIPGKYQDNFIIDDISKVKELSSVYIDIDNTLPNNTDIIIDAVNSKSYMKIIKQGDVVNFDYNTKMNFNNAFKKLYVDTKKTLKQESEQFIGKDLGDIYNIFKYMDNPEMDTLGRYSDAVKNIALETTKENNFMKYLFKNVELDITTVEKKSEDLGHGVVESTIQSDIKADDDGRLKDYKALNNLLNDIKNSKDMLGIDIQLGSIISQDDIYNLVKDTSITKDDYLKRVLQNTFDAGKKTTDELEQITLSTPDEYLKIVKEKYKTLSTVSAIGEPSNKQGKFIGKIQRLIDEVYLKYNKQYERLKYSTILDVEEWRFTKQGGGKNVVFKNFKKKNIYQYSGENFGLKNIGINNYEIISIRGRGTDIYNNDLMYRILEEKYPNDFKNKIIVPMSETSGNFVVYDKKDILSDQSEKGYLYFVELGKNKYGDYISDISTQDISMSLYFYLKAYGILDIDLGKFFSKEDLLKGKSHNDIIVDSIFGINSSLNEGVKGIIKEKIFVKSAKYISKMLSDIPKVDFVGALGDVGDNFNILVLKGEGTNDGTSALVHTIYDATLSPIHGGDAGNIAKGQINMKGSNIKGTLLRGDANTIFIQIIGSDENKKIFNKYIKDVNDKYNTSYNTTLKTESEYKNLIEDMINNGHISLVTNTDTMKIYGRTRQQTNGIYDELIILNGDKATEFNKGIKLGVYPLKGNEIGRYGIKGSRQTLQNLPPQFWKIFFKNSELKYDEIKNLVLVFMKNQEEGIKLMKEKIDSKLLGESIGEESYGLYVNYLNSIVNLLSVVQFKGYSTIGSGIGVRAEKRIKEILGYDESEHIVVISDKVKFNNDIPEKQGKFETGDNLISFRNPIESKKGITRPRVVFLDDIKEQLKNGDIYDQSLIGYLNKKDTIFYSEVLRKFMGGDFDGDLYYLIMSMSKDPEFIKEANKRFNTKEYNAINTPKPDKELSKGVLSFLGIAQSRINGKGQVGTIANKGKKTMSTDTLVYILENKGIKNNDFIKRYKKLYPVVDYILGLELKQAVDAIDVGETYNYAGILLEELLGKTNNLGRHTIDKLIEQFEKGNINGKDKSNLGVIEIAKLIPSLVKDKKIFSLDYSNLMSDASGFMGESDDIISTIDKINKSEKALTDITNEVKKVFTTLGKDVDLYKEIGDINSFLVYKSNLGLNAFYLEGLKKNGFVFDDVLSYVAIKKFVGSEKFTPNDFIYIKNILGSFGIFSTNKYIDTTKRVSVGSLENADVKQIPKAINKLDSLFKTYIESLDIKKYLDGDINILPAKHKNLLRGIIGSIGNKNFYKAFIKDTKLNDDVKKLIINLKKEYDDIIEGGLGINKGELLFLINNLEQKIGNDKLSFIVGQRLGLIGNDGLLKQGFTEYYKTLDNTIYSTDGTTLGIIDHFLFKGDRQKLTKETIVPNIETEKTQRADRQTETQIQKSEEFTQTQRGPYINISENGNIKADIQTQNNYEATIKDVKANVISSDVIQTYELDNAIVIDKELSKILSSDPEFKKLSDNGTYKISQETKNIVTEMSCPIF